MNYRKITLSASVIAFVSALVFGGTQAFFSDEETSEANVFAAGAIDLLVDSEQHYAGMVCVNEGTLEDPDFRWQDEDDNDDNNTRPELLGEPCEGSWSETDLGPEHTFFSFSDLKPGDEGENTISLHVIDNDAYMCAIIDNMQTADNGCNEPELGAEGDEYGEGNETCGDPGEGEGELQNELHFFAWTDDGGDGFGDEEQDEEGDNIWQENEQILFSNVSGPASDVIDGVVYPLYTPDTGAITGSTTNYIGLSWCYGEVSTDGGTFSCDGASASNITQSDSLSADITFYAEQARNNEDFQCPTLEEEPQRPLVGADLASYTQSDQCTVTVGSAGEYQTIQAAIDGEDAGTTICVDDGVYDEDVLVNKSGMTLSGAGASNSSTINGQAPNFGGALVIDADNVTVEGFIINGATDSQHAVRFATGISGATFQSNQVNAPNGGNALLTQGDQSGHVIQNNELIGDDSPQVVYVNGDASLSQPSDDVDFMGNTFAGTIVSGGMALGVESTNSDVTRNVFENTLTSSFTITEFWKEDALVNENNFHDTTGVQVTNSENTSPLNAENNWWGEATPSGHTSSNVDDDPMAPSAFPEN